MADDRDRMQESAARIQALVDQFAASPDAAVRERSQELVRLLMQLYGSGLERILHILEQQAGRDSAVIEALARDELVSSLLVLHDLHPDDSAARVARELERIRPIARAKLTLVALEERAARVRVEGGGGAKSPGAPELRRLIDEIVRAAAPEVERVEIEGLDEAHTVLVQLTNGRPAASGGPARS